MPHGYSLELRTRALAALDKGKPRKKVAEIFNISTRTLYNWYKLRLETGHLHPQNRPTVRSHRKLKPEMLFSYLEKHPDAYLKEIGDAFGVSGTAIFKALKKFGISRKKNEALLRARREKRDKPSQQKSRRLPLRIWYMLTRVVSITTPIENTPEVQLAQEFMEIFPVNMCPEPP